MRNFVENYHENWKCSRQIYWSNQPVENTKDYFYVILVIPFNDQVCVEYRFPGNELTQYRGLYTISYVMLNKSSGWEKEFMIFLIIIMRTFQILINLMQTQTSGTNFEIVQDLKATCLIIFLLHQKGLTYYLF